MRSQYLLEPAHRAVIVQVVKVLEGLTNGRVKIEGSVCRCPARSLQARQTALQALPEESTALQTASPNPSPISPRLSVDAPARRKDNSLRRTQRPQQIHRPMPTPNRHRRLQRPPHIVLRRPHLLRRPRSGCSTSPASSALENAHPVPWVDRRLHPLARNPDLHLPLSRKSLADSRCPPVTTTCNPGFPRILRQSQKPSAAAGTSSAVRTAVPVSIPNSSRFGVIQPTFPNNFSRKAFCPGSIQQIPPRTRPPDRIQHRRDPYGSPRKIRPRSVHFPPSPSCRS